MVVKFPPAGATMISPAETTPGKIRTPRRGASQRRRKKPASPQRIRPRSMWAGRTRQREPLQASRIGSGAHEQAATGALQMNYPVAIPWPAAISRQIAELVGDLLCCYLG